MTTQGYLAADVGQSKVLATAAALRQIEPAVDVQVVEDRYRPKCPLGAAAFCCVDSISARAALWRSASNRCQFWADGRMWGEVIRVLAVSDAKGITHARIDGHREGTLEGSHRKTN